jgi:hypothetical protein
MDENNNALELTIANFCSNLKSLLTKFENGEID